MSDELRANYAAAFGGKAGFGSRPALILIDFVEAYFAEESALYAGVESALGSALRLREAAGAAGIPVILTNVVYQPGGIDGGRFFEKVPALKLFEAGSPMGAWPEGLEPRAGEIVLSKQYPSAFFGTSLASTLTARGIDQVILTGLSTSGCVRATCVDAVSHGFRTAVVADACGDRHPGPHEANLFDMGAKYADVVSEAEALSYLSGLGDGE
jgi:maleamate amidohydrolase